MTRYRPVIRIVSSLILWIMAPYAFAQGGGTVTLGGVGANSLPILSAPVIGLLGIAILLISAVKLRRHQFLGLVILLFATGTLLRVGPISAVVDLVIPNSSPACSGGKDTIAYDSETSPMLTNECTSETVRIMQYTLPCPSDIWEGSGSIGTLLAPKESTRLLSCGDYPPEFTLGAPVTVAEDAGPQTFSHWITDISPGPAEESAQTVSFTASADEPSLFSEQPAIAPDGTLSFTAADNAWGSTNITVTATDSAGSTSDQNFLLTITPVNDPPFFSLSTHSLPILEDNGQDLNTDKSGPDFDSGPDGVSYTQVSFPNVVEDFSAGLGESDQTFYFTVDVVRAYQTRRGVVSELSSLWFFYDDEVVITESGALEFKLKPHAWGNVQLDITLTDSEGVSTAAQRLDISIIPVWDNIPTGEDFFTGGRENSDCIPVNVRGDLHRNIDNYPLFKLVDITFAPGKSGTLKLDGGDPITLPYIHERGLVCFDPTDGQHSYFNPERGDFDNFATITYQVWTGLGDPDTGLSPRIPGYPDVYNELSEEYQVDIIVTPVF